MGKKSIVSALFGCLLTLPTFSSAESSLPEIGSEGYSVITQQQEYNLGRAWVRMLRGSTRIYEDPQVSQYLKELTWSLVTHSQLSDRRLEIITLDNPTLNAFAVPGGIIGIHAGLLLAAGSEAELASVLSHELAHLSQRHFAAQLEEQRRNKPLMLASLLGSILLASANSEAGIAGIQASLANSVSSRLAFSRQNEREADYIGMQTLASAGYDPHAMPNMFSQLQKAARFSRVPPEFLLTHPVTQSRISESLDRADRVISPSKRYNTLAYNLVKARVQVHYADKPRQLLERYDQQLVIKGNQHELLYAAALTALKLEQFALAEKYIGKFPAKTASALSTRLLKIELLMAQQQFKEAANALSNLRAIYPDNRAADYLYAESMIHLNQPAKAVKAYEKLVEKQPEDSNAWYLLAEAYGLTGDIIRVHDARIEYFLLTANIDRALQQIEFALRERDLSSYDKARFEQRRLDAKAIRKSLEMNF